MNICQDHWDRLREAIKDRGLDHLVAPDGEIAVAQVKAELEAGEQTPTSYDPLMGAYWAIASNAGQTIRESGGNPLYSMMSGDEEPVELPGGEGRTWPRCVLCYLNLAHELTCDGCELPKVGGFDFYIERAADDALAKARELGLVE